MKKFISLILVFVILMSLSTTAFAFAGNKTIGANSTTPACAEDSLARSYSAWSAENGTFDGNSDKRLTVRPYQKDTSTKVSNAYTYTITNASGGRSYTLLVSAVDVYANTNGGGASVTAYWKF